MAIPARDVSKLLDPTEAALKIIKGTKGKRNRNHYLTNDLWKLAEDLLDEAENNLKAAKEALEKL